MARDPKPRGVTTIMTTPAPPRSRRVTHSRPSTIQIIQANVRKSAVAQAHLFRTYPPSRTVTYLLQEPHFFKDRLTSAPWTHCPYHISDGKRARTAILVPRATVSQPGQSLPHEHYVQVELPKWQGVVACGYCPPKDQIVQQLPLFDALHSCRTARWRFLGVDSNAYHETWGSDNAKSKTESRNQPQWTRGQRFMEWVTRTQGQVLNDGSATYLSDQGFSAAIDVSIWWTLHQGVAVRWRVDKKLQVSDHFPIVISVSCSSVAHPTPPFAYEASGPPSPTPREKCGRTVELRQNGPTATDACS